MVRKRVKIRYKRLIVFFVIVIVIVLLLLNILSIRISNIYVDGNYYLSDQEVIELSNLQGYPRTFFTIPHSIESNIVKSAYVESVDVSKSGFTNIHISVVENRPLYYDQTSDKVVLKDGSISDRLFNVPILINSIDSTIYDEFLKQLASIDMVVYNNISEIEYSPNDVDNELFLFTMNDGNYIYVNLNKFSSVNKYFDMVVNFNNHKGILYLDSGEYFKILDN